MEKNKYGDPTDPSVLQGPQVSKRQQERVLGYIEKGKQEGARLVMGGSVPKHLPKGYFVEPTVFADVNNRMTIAQEEIFGPVLAVIPFADEQDAIRIGNDIRFGLAAAVWTRDLRRAMLVTDKLKAGTIWVNNYRATSFTSPFGGYKDSGIGRESGIDAIREYVETKCVWISTDLDVPNPFIRR
jgi:aldehyde dehydrogenase (NAD+)